MIEAQPDPTGNPSRSSTLPLEYHEIVIVGGGCYGTFYARQLAEAKSRGRVRYQRVLVVDRSNDCQTRRELKETDDRQVVVQEWGSFFDEYLNAVDGPSRRAAEIRPSDDPSRGSPFGPSRRLSQAPSLIVPSPLMPHLMYEWLVRRARSRWPNRSIDTRAMDQGPGTPYDVPAPDGTRYVSFADWICPTHCTEPLRCPVIRGPRTWEMADAAAQLVRNLDALEPTAGPVLFECRHRVFGVGAFTVAEVLAGDSLVSEAGRPGTPVNVLIGTVSACHGALNLLHLG